MARCPSWSIQDLAGLPLSTGIPELGRISHFALARVFVVQQRKSLPTRELTPQLGCQHQYTLLPLKNRACTWVFFHFLYLHYQQFGREYDLLWYLHVILCAGATNSTVINAIKSRVPPSLQAEHFASGQILSMDSPHLLYFSELQNPHSAPGLAFNPQGDPVLFQQSRALTFLVSEGHGGWSGGPTGEPPSSREVGGHTLS